MAWPPRAYVPSIRHQPAWIRSSNNKLTTCIAFALGIFCALFIQSTIFSYSANIDKRHFPLNSLKIDDLVCNNTQSSPPITSIPNIVHYVWLLKDPSSFHLDFGIFTSIYSAHLYFQPDTIYIHTDASPDAISNATEHGDQDTKSILNLPNVKINHVIPPTHTKTGIEIKHLAHKSDFIRISALLEHGGIYLDTDAIPLRPVTSLLTSGFRNVFGEQKQTYHAGYVNNGIMMSVPGSTLMKIWQEAANEFFDGQWETTSIFLLTDLANRMVGWDGEVLVLHPNAFSPTNWEYKSMARLFEPHLEAVAGRDLFDKKEREPFSTCKKKMGCPESCGEKFEELKERDAFGKEDWEMDISSTYVMHAFNNGIENIRGWDHVVDLRYVLRRQSNYARIVYPAVKHAVDAGVVIVE